jgi:hypothetical protein
MQQDGHVPLPCWCPCWSCCFERRVWVTKTLARFAARHSLVLVKHHPCCRTAACNVSNDETLCDSFGPSHQNDNEMKQCHSCPAECSKTHTFLNASIQLVACWEEHRCQMSRERFSKGSHMHRSSRVPVRFRMLTTPPTAGVRAPR